MATNTYVGKAFVSKCPNDSPSSGVSLNELGDTIVVDLVVLSTFHMNSAMIYFELLDDGHDCSHRCVLSEKRREPSG